MQRPTQDTALRYANEISTATNAIVRTRYFAASRSETARSQFSRASEKSYKGKSAVEVGTHHAPR